MISRFEQQVKSQPDKTAIIFQHKQLSYQLLLLGGIAVQHAAIAGQIYHGALSRQLGQVITAIIQGQNRSALPNGELSAILPTLLALILGAANHHV